MTHPALVRPRQLCAAIVLLAIGVALRPALAGAQERYRTPPQVVVDMLDAPLTPLLSVNPDRTILVLADRASMPPLAELAQPMLRLAGARINPATNGPHRAAYYTGLHFKRIADGTDRRVATPAGARLGGPQWSPDGRMVAFTVTEAAGIALWAASVETGQAWAVTGATLNAAFGTPCQWMPDSAELLCRFVTPGRGAAPAEPAVPAGPNSQIAEGRAAPVRTYEDMLENPHDEQLFDYYMTSRLGRVHATTRAVTWLGEPALYNGNEPSPDGRYVVVQKVHRPFSYQVPSGLFPLTVELWDRDGRVVRPLAEVPLGDRIPVRGVRNGPRGFSWRPTAPATLMWVEPLDGGDPRTAVPQRDKLVALTLPATEPVEIARTAWRYAGLQWFGQGGMALLSESDRATRRVRTWMVNPDVPGTAPREIWNRQTEDRYGDPGRLVMRPTPAGDLVIMQSADGRYAWLNGDGASAEGDRPFLDRLDLRTWTTERLFRSADPYYETPITVLDGATGRLLTMRESQTEPQNYFVRETRARSAPRALIDFRDPAPQLSGVSKQLVTYRRADGVQLSGTLFLPPGYTPGTRLPLILWVYPAEFASADAASQVRGSQNRFTRITGPSHLFLLTQGYAILDNPSMPVIGGDSANNSYVSQVVAGAQAAIDKIVEMGVADRSRVGVGGHSYGAFTTANLLAHSDLFRTGIARSGAYNRTLTPFGFQNEERTFWQAPQVYAAMSPFYYADRVNEPILMIHGEADDNSGTFPIQSDRMFAALKGNGAHVQLVTYPFEAHGYASRETILDCIARMIDWFDRYVKPESTPQRAAVIP